MAAARLAQEKPGQTLQATALVHEAYLTLVGVPDKGSSAHWNSRGHFFAAAGEAMRRSLIMNARRRAAEKRGGGRERIALDPTLLPAADRGERLLDVDEALTRLERQYPEKARLVKLRFFAGLIRVSCDLSVFLGKMRFLYSAAALERPAILQIGAGKSSAGPPATAVSWPLAARRRSSLFSLPSL